MPRLSRSPSPSWVSVRVSAFSPMALVRVMRTSLRPLAERHVEDVLAGAEAARADVGRHAPRPAGR